MNSYENPSLPLFRLLALPKMAQGRIAQKRDVAFGYLAQLLLQTVPGVRAQYVAAFGYRPWEQKLKHSLKPNLTIRPGSPSRATNPSDQTTLPNRFPGQLTL